MSVDHILGNNIDEVEPGGGPISGCRDCVRGFTIRPVQIESDKYCYLREQGKDWIFKMKNKSLAHILMLCKLGTGWVGQR